MFKVLPIAFDSPNFNRRTMLGDLNNQEKNVAKILSIYSTILTKNKSHLAHFDHARYPYISLSFHTIVHLNNSM